MFLKFALPTLLLACAISASSNYHVDPLIAQHQRTLNIFFKALSQNPSTRADQSCFDKYLEDFSEILEEYNQELNSCENTANEELENLNRENQAEINRQKSLARESIEGLQECEEIVDAYEFYICYGDKTIEASRRLTSLSSESKTAAINTNTRVVNIENERRTCDTVAYAEFTTASQRLQDNLQACLNPSQTTSTTASTTPSTQPTAEPPTEEPPTTTTEEDSTITEEDSTTTEEDSTTTEEDSTTTEEESTTTEEETTTTEEDSTTTTEEETTTTEEDSPTTPEEDSTTPEEETTTTEVETPTTEEETTTTDEEILPEEDLDFNLLSQNHKLRFLRKH